MPFNPLTLCLHPGPLYMIPRPAPSFTGNPEAVPRHLLSHRRAAPTFRLVDAGLSNALSLPLHNCTHLLLYTLFAHSRNPYETRTLLPFFPARARARPLRAP